MSVATLVGQRIFAIALGYEDLNDYETPRHDPLMAVQAGKLEARRPDCAAVAGKSTLNRLELSKPERRATTRSATMRRRWTSYSSICLSMRIGLRPARSRSTSMLPMIRCMASRRGGRARPIHAVKLALRPLPRASIITTCHFRKCRSEGERCWIWLRRVL